jgi:hypothetical protein
MIQTITFGQMVEYIIIAYVSGIMTPILVVAAISIWSSNRKKKP